MQRAVFFVVRGIHVRTLVLTVVQLGAGPLEDDLQALSPAAFILIGPGEAGVEGSLFQQDAGAHAQQVQCCLVVHIAFVGVAILVKEEGPGVVGWVTVKTQKIKAG